MGFVKRKAVFFAEPKWLKITEDLARRDSYVALYDIGLKIPGVLERTDTLSKAESIPADFVCLCRDICQLRTDLRDWLEKFYISKSKELYRIVDVRDMREFAHLCLDRTFQTVFYFGSVQMCSQQQLYWISCLVLDFTLLAICRRSLVSEPYPRLRLQDFTDRTEEDIERELYVAATSYCRSVPYCCEPETASIGRIGTFLLRISQSYFEQCGHCRELEWTVAVRQMLNQSPTEPTENSADEVPGAPWSVRHRCKSPICNFRKYYLGYYMSPIQLLIIPKASNVSHLHPYC